MRVRPNSDTTDKEKVRRDIENCIIHQFFSPRYVRPGEW